MKLLSLRTDIILALIATLIFSIFLVSPRTQAWSENPLPVCGQSIDYIATLNASAYQNRRDAATHIQTADPSMQYALGYTASDDKYYLLLNKQISSMTIYPDSLKWHHDPNTNNFYISGEYNQSQMYIFNSDGSEYSATSNTSQADFSCFVESSGNIVQAQSFIDAGGTVPTGGSETPEPSEPRCSALDIACWFSSFTGNVIDGFQALGDLFTGIISTLGEWIANLIMPSNENGEFENRFTSIFTDLHDTMKTRLGVLLFPFEFIANFFAALLAPYNQYGGELHCKIFNGNSQYSFCNISIPKLLGNADVSFNLGALEQKVEPVFNMAVNLLRFVWIVGLVGFLHKKYYGILKA